MEMHSDDEFTQAFDYASGVTMERFQNPLWSLTELFTGSRFRKAVLVVRSFGRTIVSKAVVDRNAAKDSGAAMSAEETELDEISGSLIQSFLDSIGDEKIVADAALNYLSAGMSFPALASADGYSDNIRARYDGSSLNLDFLHADEASIRPR
jgi:hypothetical protein